MILVSAQTEAKSFVLKFSAVLQLSQMATSDKQYLSSKETKLYYLLGYCSLKGQRYTGGDEKYLELQLASSSAHVLLLHSWQGHLWRLWNLPQVKPD